MASKQATTFKLSKADRDAIANTVLKAIMPQDTEEDNKQEETVIEDPIRSAVDDKMTAIIKTLPTGIAVVKGRRGTTIVNRSEESLNTLQDILAARKNWRTQTKVR